ncbi:hypothetical protein GCM10010129_31060 [Streptomyces fumigatiscleroticus]|nr:hypothetical protein GCM10010129_31060 [Streptomyces fumigatiscleroticus]
MGWTVLYIAFGIVALWLLGEVLLQYKARLRWRLLAFGGFLGVVVGVLIPSVVVIGLGAIAFAVGQTYVTLSFRRGFAAGWAVSAPALTGGRGRRPGRGRQEPTLEVSGLQETGNGLGDDTGEHHRAEADHGHDRDDVFAATAAETTTVYEPQPVPDDTGSYGVYDDSAYTTAGQDQYATAAQGADQGYAYDGYSGYDQTQQHYGYGASGEQQYAAYSDPYIGTHSYGGGAYDTGYGDQQQYGQQGYGQDQYADGGLYGETPPGGVWVPQQRGTEEPYGGELPPEQSAYPYQGNGRTQGGHGYDEQYRF